jgi:RNA polymerase sigma factor (sigma-70 family)
MELGVKARLPELTSWLASPESLAETPMDVEAAFDQYHAPIWKYLALMTRNAADADEYASEVFARAYAASQRGKAPAGDWLPWLLLTARRLIISRWRRQMLLHFVQLPSIGPPSESNRSFDDVESSIWLDQITRLLPARQREALFLRYLGDLDDSAVGRVLGLSPSGVRSLVSRAMTTLRDHPELWA